MTWYAHPYSPARRLHRSGLAVALIAALALPLVDFATSPGTPASAQSGGLPPGFTMEVFATGLPTPRGLSFSPQGDLYVADMGSGNIAVLPDRNHDGKADSTITFASGFVSPQNVAFYQGAAYAGEAGRVWRLVDTTGNLQADQRTVVVDNIPSDGRHRTRTVGFGPDGKLYVNVGSYNDDAPEPAGRAAIWQYNPDGSGGRIYARGLRNTVGFDWDPSTGQMWGTDNGADDLGRNQPPDELNQIIDGGNYGYPYCIGNRQPNPRLSGVDCSSTIPPAANLPPHGAPLGMTFYTGSSFPASYWGGVFATLHSISYPNQRGIVFVPFKDGKPSGPAQTFLSTGDTWVGVAVSPYDGSLYASQDGTGTIYRISYSGAGPAPAPPGPAPTAVAGKPAPIPASPLPGMARCFAETGKCLRGAFLNFWFANGGLTRFGLPVTGELSEKLEDGKTYTVQYTERARLEYHPENKGTQYEVLLGRLGFDLAAPRANEQPFRRVPPCGNCGLLYFQQTGHHVGADLQSYWQSNGGIPVFGYPLSEAFNEKSPTDGKVYLVQYFERNRLEYHPENKGTAYEVLLGLLGVQSYQSRYGAKP